MLLAYEASYASEDTKHAERHEFSKSVILHDYV